MAGNMAKSRVSIPWAGQIMSMPAGLGQASPPPLRHAVVIGGSIAGLLAARVLSDHAERVTIVERDRLDGGPWARKGVPQGSHVHALLVRGRSILEALLPGLSAELLQDGAALVRCGRDLAWHYLGGWRAAHESELAFLCASRPLLEVRVAARVRALPNVAVRDQVRVEGLESDGRGRVTGVRVHGRQASRETIAADLVVDAAGRGSALPHWLAEIGFDPPPVERLPTSVGYASRVFRRPDQVRTWQALIVNDAAQGKRTGLILPIEGERWLVTLVGFLGQSMPQDHNTFLAFARALPAPDLYQAIRDAEPLSCIASFRFPGSQRHRYAALDRMPEGVIALGDAVSSFNPVYGQGMTVGAIEAEMLGRLLARARGQGGLPPDFGRRWFRAIEPVVDAAWNAVTLEDLRFPELAHLRSAKHRALHWYTRHLHRATHRSALATDRFYRVMNFLAPPGTLFCPRLVAEIFLRRPSWTPPCLAPSLPPPMPPG